jgi:hypothetical protein
MIDCKKCEDLIQKVLDGEIKEAERGQMHAHVEKCVSCNQEWQFFKELQNIMQDYEPVDAPPDLISRLTANFAEKPKVGFFEGYVAPFFLQNRIRLAMASFILMIAGVGLLYSYYENNNIESVYDRADRATGSTIGIRSSGNPTFIIPASEDVVVIEENDEAVEEIEEALRGDYNDPDIHLATD